MEEYKELLSMGPVEDESYTITPFSALGSCVYHENKIKLDTGIAASTKFDISSAGITKANMGMQGDDPVELIVSYYKDQWFGKMVYAYAALNSIKEEDVLRDVKKAMEKANSHGIADNYSGYVNLNVKAIGTTLQVYPALLNRSTSIDGGIIENGTLSEVKISQAQYQSIFNKSITADVSDYYKTGKEIAMIKDSFDYVNEDWKSICEFVETNEITGVTMDAKGIITISTNSSGESIAAALGETLNSKSDYMADEFMDQEVNTLLNKSVKTSAIMSRKENILISWEDLKACGFVVDTFNGHNPEKDATGTYNIQTVYGLVKVNPGAHTILIGNTYYNLDDNGTGPTLVYIHAAEDTAAEDVFYLDYRCIMGLCSENLRKNEDMTSAIKSEDSLGVGSSVVYNLTVGEVDSKLFKTKEFNTYIYPDVDKFSGTSTGVKSYYKTNLLTETMYEGETIVNNTVAHGSANREFTYWDKMTVGSNKRMTMSTFNPVSNWLLSIRQTDSLTEASLYVWYPKTPFIWGYLDLDGTKKGAIQNKDNKDWKSLAEQAASECFIYNGKNFSSIWESSYGACMNWYDWMTMYSSAKLFNESNGGYYISKDYVCRRFELSDNSATSVMNEFSTDTNLTSNSIGAMYWLEGIGYVYNIPNVNQFSMEKYLNGTYPLPVCLDNDGTYGTLGLVNFNVDYYGEFNLAGENKVYPSTYGEVLSAEGVIDLSGKVIKKEEELKGYWSNDKEKQSIQLTIEQEYPFNTDAGSLYIPAPAGMYSVFGGMGEEATTSKSFTSYVTSANHIYYGSKRILFDRSDAGKNYYFLGMGNYPAVSIPDNIQFRRVYHNVYDVLIAFPDGIQTDSGGRVAEVDISNEYANPLRNFLDGWGATNLLDTLDKGSSFIITVAMIYLPIFALIAMTLLIGLAYMGQAKFFRNFCDTVVDPVEILTMKRRNIHTWEFRRVILPCVILYIVFATLYNGNIIRIITVLAEWYDVINKWLKTF